MKKMNKKFKTLGLITLGFLSTLSTNTFANDKDIGMINTAILFKEHPKFKEVELELKESIKKLEESLLEDKKLIEEEQEQLNEKTRKKLISRTNIKKEQKAIDDKIFLLEEKRKVFNENKQNLENQKRIEILKDIQENVVLYANKNQYKAILDSGSVVFVKQGNNVTEEVLKQIKENYKK